MQWDALIGLGSNKGDKISNIHEALKLLEDCKDIDLQKISSLYKSAPWGIREQDWFVNAVAAITTKLDAHSLLKRCLDIESRMGREREIKWGPRVIDIDILVYRDEIINTPTLKIPHPYIEERGFVLVPLNEIAPLLKIRGQDVSILKTKIDVSDVMPI
ncbi:MAG: 2-amino-4-hydroxy-6-hydroxymethyldihydropteridine diphosphokinase [Hyphomicrobium sp.]